MKNIAIILFILSLIGATITGCTTRAASTVPTKPAEDQGKLPQNAEKLDPSKQAPAPIMSLQASSQAKEQVSEQQPLFEYPDAVRGIYVTAHSAGGERFEKLLKLVDSTDLNAMVIDIKDDYGNITFKTDGEMEPFSKPYMKDPKALLKTLSEHKVYPIARIVVFKDTELAGEHPDWSFRKGEQVWKNGKGDAFVNPFVKDVWDYNIKVAKEAAKLGFKEIQFDYVRFPEGFEKKDKSLVYSMGDYTKEKLEPRLIAEWEKQDEEWKALHTTSVSSPTPGGAKPAMAAPINQQPLQEPQKPVYDAVTARVQAVTDFVAYAKQELRPLGVKVSVDIFGYTATLPEAPGIGQNFSFISNNVDVISSMIYPSHWGPGYFNIAKPDKEPYRLVQEYEKMEKEKLSKLDHAPLSRPWIQDFTATWLGKGNYIPYGKSEVEQQIKALNEAGVKEYLIWNASNNYSEGVDYTPLKKD